ncbi:response regulator [Botrimarina hoheduenensis]|uniref:Chemotaxis protein CheY n=1 Tax=Botrimarina hoheduenensis TaxID=2528000 RepID=A0A5C5W948_9BACT|nr:response regulator [Botrimarina hoheduenensis]TWT47408.1 Chemotaxis protein CheY [Botrimarina hoheduenensis]
MKLVLDVGNCDPDHAAVTAFFTNHFEARVDRAKLPADALEKLRAQPYDLVVINRKLDEDYSDGVEILKAIKADDALKATPVMLITNYEEHQDAAVAAGALRGFGKLEYGKPETLERVRAVLG